MRLRCVATAFGSAGDFLPTLAIAAELHRAGHEVTFVSNPFFEPKARAEGLSFVASGEHVDLFERLESEPIYGDTLRGPDALWRDFAIPDASATYRTIRELLSRRSADVVVCANTSVGGVWAGLEARVPTVLVAASPAPWMRGDAPMQFADHEIPPFALGWAARILRASLELFLDGRMSALASRLGARVDDPSLSGIERAVDLHLGMWSPHMRDRAPGDPPNQRVCGFAQGGHLGHAAALDAELDAFLEREPVVVGLGSFFSLVAHEDLSHAAHACAELDVPCLVVGHPAQSWSAPKGTLAVKYAPYHLVFPRARVVVTHGGAGSTAEALRTGRPVIVAPFGFDQFALGWHVQRLGAGVRVRKGGRDRASWRRALETVLDEDHIAARASELAPRFRAERDGAVVAREHIESLLASG